MVSSPSGADRGDTLATRRLARLREAIADEDVPLPIDGPEGSALLVELAYARQPPMHEAAAPRYGALLSHQPIDWSGCDRPVVVPLCRLGDGLALARRAADGRGSFLVVENGRPTGLACFPYPLSDEANAVRVHEGTGAVVVQRERAGFVRVVTSDGVVEWDATRWWMSKPLASGYLPGLRRLVPHADADVLGGVLELAVHWLSAGRVGATLVCAMPAEDRPESLVFHHLDISPAVPSPPLSLTERAHFPAILNLLRQLDRAALITPEGRLDLLGAGLVASDDARLRVAATRGTRHTSGRRFSYDEPGTLVVVVSEEGPVSIYSDGAVLVERNRAHF